ncbi:hypothetical protein LCGC14_1200510, partial [marine sediment metagenome]
PPIVPDEYSGGFDVLRRKVARAKAQRRRRPPLVTGTMATVMLPTFSELRRRKGARPAK